MTALLLLPNTPALDPIYHGTGVLFSMQNIQLDIIMAMYLEPSAYREKISANTNDKGVYQSGFGAALKDLLLVGLDGRGRKIRQMKLFSATDAPCFPRYFVSNMVKIAMKAKGPRQYRWSKQQCKEQN